MKIATKFSKDSYFTIAMYFFAIVVAAIFLGKSYMVFDKVSVYSFIGVQVLFFSIIIVCLLFLNIHKKITIDTLKKTVYYTSVLNPFGKTLLLKNYKNWIVSTEITGYEPISMVYLLNHQMETAFKINTSLYKNRDDFMSALQYTELKEVSYYPFGKKDYLKLIFTGKLKIIIPKTKENRKPW